MDEKYVSIIILNYITWKNTLSCVKSLLEFSSQNFNIIIVDNNSDNNSLEIIKENLTCRTSEIIYDYNKLKTAVNGFRIYLIQCKENFGYAKGNNIGMKFAERFNPDYFLILNSDTVLNYAALSHMIEGFEVDKNVGMVGAINYDDKYMYDLDTAKKNIRWYNVPFLYKQFSQINRLFNYYEVLEDLKNKNSYVEVEVISGSCILVNAHIMKSINYFDENTFLYFEENIIHEKLKMIGYKTLLSIRSKIIHLKGHSTKYLSIYELINHNIKSLKYYLKRYKNYWSIIILLLLMPYYFNLFKVKIKMFIKNNIFFQNVFHKTC